MDKIFSCLLINSILTEVVHSNQFDAVTLSIFEYFHSCGMKYTVLSDPGLGIHESYSVFQRETTDDICIKFDNKSFFALLCLGPVYFSQFRKSLLGTATAIWWSNKFKRFNEVILVDEPWTAMRCYLDYALPKIIPRDDSLSERFGVRMVFMECVMLYGGILVREYSEFSIQTMTKIFIEVKTNIDYGAIFKRVKFKTNPCIVEYHRVDQGSVHTRTGGSMKEYFPIFFKFFEFFSSILVNAAKFLLFFVVRIWYLVVNMHSVLSSTLWTCNNKDICRIFLVWIKKFEELETWNNRHSCFQQATWEPGGRFSFLMLDKGEELVINTSHLKSSGKSQKIFHEGRKLKSARSCGVSVCPIYREAFIIIPECQHECRAELKEFDILLLKKSKCGRRCCGCWN
ncbi:uncharacterized protein LOC113330642 [Papaver somniferum]|uniref:uncharacterized protein LOC113330642 n=1 Tax=Papaver somniferum TaxID=3469 RepID=UPI000E6FDAA5|nr:uncharacterized protein LOC113330642 [Papaver somniferum]